MIPEKGKKYAIAFQNEAWHDISYSGVAICNGELDGWDDPNTGFEQWYGFDVEGEEDTVFFAEGDIIGEII